MATSERIKAPVFPAHDMAPRILLGPGPDTVHPRVTAAMSAPLLGHLDPGFLTLMDRTQQLLRYTFQTQNRLTLPISGTGSAGMEAAIASIVEPGDAVLVCVNGYFGSRIAEMARRHGGQVDTIERAWGEVFSADEVRDALHGRPARVVAIVHAETSTGALQPLEDIVQVVHDNGALLIVDAVTSLAGVPLHVDELGLDVVYSGTQKCLGCPPGLAPITVGPRGEEWLTARKTSVDTWYLDLSMVKRYWGPARTHHTAPIALNFALYEALRMVAEEGLEARWARHGHDAALLWDGLAELGMSLHVPLELRLPSLTTVRIPDGVDDAGVRRSCDSGNPKSTAPDPCLVRGSVARFCSGLRAPRRQHRRPADRAGRQRLEDLVASLEREEIDRRSDRDGGGQGHEFGGVAASHVGHTAQLALPPQPVVRELGHAVQVDRVDGDDAAAVHCAQGGHDHVAYRGRGNGRVKGMWRRVVVPADRGGA
jgi:alanine-glyoxylate transaminase/serine-glyoxylate transaminase/serine-pyruvate transaminase